MLLQQGADLCVGRLRKCHRMLWPRAPARNGRAHPAPYEEDVELGPEPLGDFIGPLARHRRQSKHNNVVAIGEIGKSFSELDAGLTPIRVDIHQPR